MGATAETIASRKHRSLRRDMRKAKKEGKKFFDIDTLWDREEKETFQKGISPYFGISRESFCELIGLTTQWVYSASPDALDLALHNLQLMQSECSEQPEDKVRQRLLMFLRYG